MLRNFIVAAIFVLVSFAPVSAQSNRGTWIQVETLDTQDEAIARILAYKTFLPSTSGFMTEGGKYAVLVGPFTSLEGQFLLSQFRQTGLIPPDSFVSSTEEFAGQFYPEQEAAEQDPPKQTQPDTLVIVDENGNPQMRSGEETAAQARTSERLLSKDEKKLLQLALQDGGHYSGAIDGLYGRGTRASMKRWQAANFYEQTGVLTTLQRQELLDQYYAILSELGMERVVDRKAGIAMEMPTAVVKFDGYTAPFAHYRSVDGGVAELHLISQPGDRTSLYALYDVMQSLSIVPIDGHRKKNRNNFILTGQNDEITSHTEAYLSGGQIKGFTLVWPAQRADQAERLIERLSASFETTLRILPKGQGTSVEPGQDSMGGLSLRKATAIVSGAFINDAGTVLTSSAITEQCEKISVLDDVDYAIVAHSAELGVSVLEPKTPVSPLGFGKIKAVPNRSDTSVSLAGYSFGGILSAPTMTHGRIVSTTGLDGEAHLDRLEMTHFASDAGGPVLGTSGDIVGVLNGRDTSSERQLPAEVSFMTDNSALAIYLKDAGVDHTLSIVQSTKSAIEIAKDAREMTVWVSCWE